MCELLMIFVWKQQIIQHKKELDGNTQFLFMQFLFCEYIEVRQDWSIFTYFEMISSIGISMVVISIAFVFKVNVRVFWSVYLAFLVEFF